MPHIRRPVLTDPSPEPLRRHARRTTDPHERRLILRFIWLLTGENNQRCEICGADDAETGNQRCRDACEG
jgi:hypothetical protein